MEDMNPNNLEKQTKVEGLSSSQEQLSQPEIKSNSEQENLVISEGEGQVAEVLVEESSNLEAAPEQTLEKDPQLLAVEKALSEPVIEIYKKLDFKKQQEIKQTGEDLALKINKILINPVKPSSFGKLFGGRSVKEEILKLVTAWLKRLPQTSKEYVLQESKIITNKILENKSV